MSIYLDLFIITGTTVGKIMMCSVMGMFAARYFVEREKSERGLSFISVRILLPCLLFSNLCLSVTWESLSKFYWAPLLSCLPLGLGLASSFVFRLLLSKKYQALIMLGCTFQNGLTFPLSLLLNLKGIPWLDARALAEAQSYIFIYNLPCSIGLWAVGEPLIAAASEKEAAEAERRREEEEKEREKAESGRGTGTDVNQSFVYPFQAEEMAARVRENSQRERRHKAHQRSDGADVAEADVSSGGGDGLEYADTHCEDPYQHPHHKRGATATEQLGWYKPAKVHDKPIKPAKPPRVYTDEFGTVVVVEAEDDEAEERARKRRNSMKRIRGIIARSIQSPTVFFSLLAIVISLTPPLRWLASSFLGRTFIGGLTVVGSGAIPLQLLVLGCTIAANKPQAEEATEGESGGRSGAAGEAGAASDGAVATNAAGTVSAPRIFGCVKPSAVFVVCSVGLRMLIIPAVCFLVIHLLIVSGAMPSERPFVIAMLVATSSPAAINASVICSMHNYHAREFARMIFFMYLTATLSTAVWLFLYILYLGST